MSKHSNKLIALALVGAGSFGVWKLGAAVLGDDAQGTDHAINQLWIDRVPKNETDVITHLVILDHPQGKFGEIGRSSQWRHVIDLFKWQLRGNELGLFFPQERTRGKVSIETWECAGEAPAPFELCMKLSNDQGRSVMMYSRYEWEIRPGDAGDSLADIVDEEPTLAALLGAVDERAAAQVEAIDLDDAADWRELDGFWP